MTPLSHAQSIREETWLFTVPHSIAWGVYGIGRQWTHKVAAESAKKMGFQDYQLVRLSDWMYRNNMGATERVVTEREGKGETWGT